MTLLSSFFFSAHCFLLSFILLFCWIDFFYIISCVFFFFFFFYFFRNILYVFFPILFFSLEIFWYQFLSYSLFFLHQKIPCWIRFFLYSFMYFFFFLFVFFRYFLVCIFSHTFFCISFFGHILISISTFLKSFFFHRQCLVLPKSHFL